MTKAKTRIIVAVVLLAGASYPFSASLGNIASEGSGAYPPCVLINRPPPPFGKRLAENRPAVPLPAPGVCDN
jgi:hypothetical protein